IWVSFGLNLGFSFQKKMYQTFQQFSSSHRQYNDSIKMITYLVYLNLIENDSFQSIKIIDCPQLSRFILKVSLKHSNENQRVIPWSTHENLNFKRIKELFKVQDEIVLSLVDSDSTLVYYKIYNNIKL